MFLCDVMYTIYIGPVHYKDRKCVISYTLKRYTYNLFVEGKMLGHDAAGYVELVRWVGRV